MQPAVGDLITLQFPAPVTLEAASALAATLALIAAPWAVAQTQPVRNFPDSALRAKMVVVQPPEITLNGEPARLSPGSRIRSQNNTLVLSGALVGQEVLVTRKGAVSARAGELGIIPGSMGDKSYVVIGKGNRASLCSAPHGAGRALSRRKASARFTLDDLTGNGTVAAAGIAKLRRGARTSPSDSAASTTPPATP